MCSWPDQVLAIELQGEPQWSFRTSVSVSLWYVSENAPLAKKNYYSYRSHVGCWDSTFSMHIASTHKPEMCHCQDVSTCQKEKSMPRFCAKSRKPYNLGKHSAWTYGWHAPKASTFPSFAWIKGRISSALPRAWQGRVSHNMCTGGETEPDLAHSVFLIYSQNKISMLQTGSRILNSVWFWRD